MNLPTLSFVVYFIGTFSVFSAVGSKQQPMPPRKSRIGDSGQSGVPKVKWEITKTTQGQFLVQLSVDQFADNSWIALGLSLTPSMPNSFIISCSKKVSNSSTAPVATTTVQSRYADKHTLPPLLDWGMQPRPAPDQNSCLALLPALLKSPSLAVVQPDLILGGNQTIYVLNARGELDSLGKMLYHGGSKEINLKPLKIA